MENQGANSWYGPRTVNTTLAVQGSRRTGPYSFVAQTNVIMVMFHNHSLQHSKTLSCVEVYPYMHFKLVCLVCMSSQTFALSHENEMALRTWTFWVCKTYLLLNVTLYLLLTGIYLLLTCSSTCTSFSTWLCKLKIYWIIALCLTYCPTDWLHEFCLQLLVLFVSTQ